MEGWQIMIIIALYFGVLMIISHFTSKGADNKTFFTAGKSSPWYVVAFGMVGVSLSGVTFLSVPGTVAEKQFYYFQIVLGNVVGYIIVAVVLLPLYYKLNLTSIYEYLGTRYGTKTRKTGSVFFLISRIIGASFRLFLVTIVFQKLLSEKFGISFEVTVGVTIALIWVYTYKGGIKTVIWTDLLQTSFMLLALFGFLVWLFGEMGGISNAFSTINSEGYTRTFFFDNILDPRSFYQNIIFGVCVTLVMNGLDQDMMQKSLTCKSLRDSQKNLYSLSAIFLVVNILFLILGALLTVYAINHGIEGKGDKLFLNVSLVAPSYLLILFLLGVIAAAYSSADSALTSLTTSFCVDILGMKEASQENQKLRIKIHFMFSVILFLVLICFKAFNNKSVVEQLFHAAGLTYGPLLGLFAFGLYTKLKVSDRLIPQICILCPVISYFLKDNSESLFGYKIGFEILLVNGGLTFILMFLCNKGKEKSDPIS